MIMIEKVREIVKKECEIPKTGKTRAWDWRFWKFHIVPVVKYAKLLARKFGIDEELAELCALLHDIGAIKFGAKNHEITGIPEAEKVLKQLNCPQEVINEVKHCIESHRGSGNKEPKTIIAKIIKNADAMAHFDAIPVLIQIGLEKENNNIEKAVKWVYDKIERDWNKKLTIPEAREMMREKYEAIKLLFDSMKEYM
jgi:uncharacterized protein